MRLVSQNLEGLEIINLQTSRVGSNEYEQGKA